MWGLPSACRDKRGAKLSSYLPVSPTSLYAGGSPQCRSHRRSPSEASSRGRARSPPAASTPCCHHRLSGSCFLDPQILSSRVVQCLSTRLLNRLGGVLGSPRPKSPAVRSTSSSPPCPPCVSSSLDAPGSEWWCLTPCAMTLLLPVSGFMWWVGGC